jgi:methyl-accepting chemotaxis protein
MLFVASIAMIFIGIFGLLEIDRAQRRFDAFQEDVTQSVQDLNVAIISLYQMRVLQYRIAIQKDDAQRHQTEKRLAESSEAVASAFDKYEKSDISDVTDRTMLDRDRKLLKDLLADQEKYLDLVRANNLDAAYSLQDEGGALRTSALAAETAVSGHIKYNKEIGDQLRIANNAAYAISVWVLIGVTLAATLFTVLLGWRLQQHIRGSLEGIQSTLGHAKDRLDLTCSVSVKRLDEVGYTATAFNDLQSSVRDAMLSVRDAARTVAAASNEIAAGNEDLSSRTEEQAASLEETAASLNELTDAVQKNAGSAAHASSLATDTFRLAEEGDDAVAEMVDTIEKIRENSVTISEITTVIEGIAFQTNILALNAAVEAARAGEQGRGFAVVAGEVRVLAQRSSSAAKEIKGLIESSATTVQQGADKAAKVRVSVFEFKEAVKKVSGYLEDISKASSDQQVGISQINQAIGQMDEATQRNAALVEQAAAAAQSLSQQAQQVSSAVARFQLDSENEAASKRMS